MAMLCGQLFRISANPNVGFHLFVGFEDTMLIVDDTSVVLAGVIDQSLEA